jgi:hypothetical protein
MLIGETRSFNGAAVQMVSASPQVFIVTRQTILPGNQHVDTSVHFVATEGHDGVMAVFPIAVSQGHGLLPLLATDASGRFTDVMDERQGDVARFCRRWLLGIPSSYNPLAPREAPPPPARPKTDPLALGDILVATWGYDQTNVDFFQVTKVTLKQVEIRPIASRTNTTEPMQGTAVPVPGAFTGPPVRRAIRPGKGSYGPSVALSSYKFADRWNGRPVAWTSYA